MAQPAAPATLDYHAPWWLPGGNLQTIWAALFAQRGTDPRPEYTRERWTTPDGDFIDLDWLDGEATTSPASTPGATTLLVLFHGLEGSSRSHYAEAFAGMARRHGMAFVVPH